MKTALLPMTVLMAAALLLSGCAMVLTPATGFLYSDVKGPHAVTPNAGYSKVGTSQCTSILGWIATGDASIKAAMENGGITEIDHVDYKTEVVLGVYAKLTVIVYGD